MFYTPTRTELSTIANRLNLPTIPTKDFLSALIDVYTDFLDVEYEDIIRDIDAEYLTYHYAYNKPVVDTEVDCEFSSLGYLYYYDGGTEVLIPISK